MDMPMKRITRSTSRSAECPLVMTSAARMNLARRPSGRRVSRRRSSAARSAALKGRGNRQGMQEWSLQKRYQHWVACDQQQAHNGQHHNGHGSDSCIRLGRIVGGDVMGEKVGQFGVFIVVRLAQRDPDGGPVCKVGPCGQDELQAGQRTGPPQRLHKSSRAGSAWTGRQAATHCDFLNIFKGLPGQQEHGGGGRDGNEDHQAPAHGGGQRVIDGRHTDVIALARHNSRETDEDAPWLT